jgi:hypothetical protein
MWQKGKEDIEWREWDRQRDRNRNREIEKGR